MQLQERRTCLMLLGREYDMELQDAIRTRLYSEYHLDARQGN